MLDQRRVAAQPDEKREQLFTERYEDLLAWALRLTNQQRDAAEDLVQDAFVQFVLGRTRLEEIENIDGYLRRMLRYMHLARMSRSAQHLPETVLSIADYDSFRLGWSAVEPPRRMQASEELQQICAYACSRKESSRAGSVLILRFFHDYFPTEIAAVLNSSRDCVDQWQRLARREAKLYMNQPGRLSFVDAKATQRPVTFLRSDCDLMLELRQMIFNSCEGECQTQEELKEVYEAGHGDALATPKLAHVVSCYQCLDAVNSILGLPALAERYQTQPSHSKEPPPGDGTSGGGSLDITHKFGRRLQETREHKPLELRIAVNGFLVSSMKVGSDVSELNLNLTPDDPIEFVEVSSEQGVQLLFFSVNPARAQSEQWAWIELSEGRYIEACFRNENGPSLHVVYKDPAPEASITGETSNTLSSPLFVVPNAEETKPATHNLIARLARVLRIGRAKETARQSNDEALIESLAEATPFPTMLSVDRTRSWRRLSFLLISVAVVAGFLLFKTRLSPTLSASNLLEKSEAAEQATFGAPDTVRHRLINLEERRGGEGAVVARRRIEIWQNNTSGARAQRLYDDSNKLIAGSWEKAGDSRIVYHHGSKPRSLPRPEAPDTLLLSLEDIWQLEPSARAFRALTESSVIEVEETSTTYVLRYNGVRTAGASRLLKATLTLSKSGFHPIEQTLLVQRGIELREYRFVEANVELLPLKSAAPKVFEVEPELTGGAAEPGRPGEWALRDLTFSRVPPSPSTSAPPIASAELEVDVAYLLNQAKADRNEQVALTRSAGGSLRVEGVVDSQQRKEEFLRTLAPVSNNPAVAIAIRTVAEASESATPIGSISRQAADDTVNLVAADEFLRAYFSRKNPAGSTDDAIRSYSSKVVNNAYRALFQAIELKRLVNRFAGVDMRTLAPDARAKWIGMLHEHAQAFSRENAALRREIQPIFFPDLQQQLAEEVAIESDADLARAVERLQKLALSNNDAVRSAFTISKQSSAAAVKSAAFWQSLLRAEKLAEKIARYQTAEK